MTSQTTKTSKTTEKDTASKTITGIGAHLSTFTTIPLEAESFTPATLTGVFQDELNAINDADAAMAVWHQKVVVSTAKVARARQVRGALKRWIVATQGPGAVQVYEDLGMDPPKKPGVKSAASKAASAAKAKATRAAKKAALAAAAAPKIEPPAPAK
jgi:hypothetical protein